MKFENQHYTFMRRAIQLAQSQAGKLQGRPFGAVIASAGKILADGFNRTLVDKDPTAHAEIVAIRRACKTAGTPELVQCVIYASCQPCPMCLSAIYWAGIRTIYYGCSSARAEQVGFGDSFVYDEVCAKGQGRHMTHRQLLSGEAFKALREWKQQGGLA
ncbi:MAG: guanine deaminase [Nitrospira sp.]|nr:guanine deaminase [Nitrospira sp.]